MKIIKILFTPLMALLALVILLLGFLYFEVLVRIYRFAWEGWDDL